MGKFDIKAFENTKLSDISTVSSSSPINKNNHYEVQSFGVTIEITNYLTAAEAIFKGSASRSKKLWHNLSGRKILLEEKLG